MVGRLSMSWQGTPASSSTTQSRCIRNMRRRGSSTGKSKRAHTIRAEAGVHYEPYMVGMVDMMDMMDTVGELIGALTNGEQKEACYYYDKMMDTFDSARSIRFAEAVLQEFRRKRDMAGIQIESPASEVLHARSHPIPEFYTNQIKRPVLAVTGPLLLLIDGISLFGHIRVSNAPTAKKTIPNNYAVASTYCSGMINDHDLDSP